MGWFKKTPRDLYLEAGWYYVEKRNYRQALALYQEAASKGEPSAQFQCGWMYEHGEGTSVDKARALFWYEESARNGILQGMINCGRMYSKGDGVDKDEAKSLKWRLEAAQRGDAVAQYNCGFMYGHGKGTKEDKEQALYWYQKAAAQGKASAQYMCGLYCEYGWGTKKDEGKALEWYEKSAAQGDEDAKKKIKALQARREERELYWNRGIAAWNEERYEEALPDLLKVAEAGDAQAQFFCGNTYLRLPREDAFQQSVYWYKKSAEGGNMYAQECLGYLYAGQKTEEHEEKAIDWFQKAAAQGSEGAREELDKILKKRRVKSDLCFQRGQAAYNREQYGEALPDLLKAARLGHVQAQGLSGSIYFFGQGVKRDRTQGLYWMEKAAEQGNAVHQNLCGELYLADCMSAQDVKRALYWFEKAAVQGHAQAQFRLGCMYYHLEEAENEEVGEEYNRIFSVEKAKKWLNLARQNGQEEAAEALMKIELIDKKLQCIDSILGR